MDNKEKSPNCEVCGVRVSGEGAVASIVDGHCSNCGAVLSENETPEEGQGEGTGATE
jgi:transcription initiation factor IIE alpha subunit